MKQNPWISWEKNPWFFFQAYFRIHGKYESDRTGTRICHGFFFHPLIRRTHPYSAYNAFYAVYFYRQCFFIRASYGFSFHRVVSLLFDSDI